MRKHLTTLLALCLSLTATLFVVQGTVTPGDLDEDLVISEYELALAEQSYQEKTITSEEIDEIRHIHDNYPRQVTDYLGRDVTIYKPIKRIVCTAGQHLETLRSLQVSRDIIVGVPEGIIDESYFSEFSDYPSIGSFYEPDVEAILELEPDVIIAHPGPDPGGNSLDEVLQTMEDSGITLLCFKCNLPERYPQEIRTLGVLLEKENEAETFLEFYDGVLNTVEKNTASLSEDKMPQVYSEYLPYRTNSLLDMGPIEMAGGSIIFPDDRQIRDVDPEVLISADPEIILILSWGGDYDQMALQDTARLDEARKELKARPELQNLKALQEDQVYVMTSPFWTYLPGSSCRHFIGVAYLAKLFHPLVFQDLDPQALHQRYLSEFQGLDYDLSEKGVFIYPPLK